MKGHPVHQEKWLYPLLVIEVGLLAWGMAGTWTAVTWGGWLTVWVGLAGAAWMVQDYCRHELQWEEGPVWFVVGGVFVAVTGWMGQQYQGEWVEMTAVSLTHWLGVGGTAVCLISSALWLAGKLRWEQAFLAPMAVVVGFQFVIALWHFILQTWWWVVSGLLTAVGLVGLTGLAWVVVRQVVHSRLTWLLVVILLVSGGGLWRGLAVGWLVELLIIWLGVCLLACRLPDAALFGVAVFVLGWFPPLPLASPLQPGFVLVGGLVLGVAYSGVWLLRPNAPNHLLGLWITLILWRMLLTYLGETAVLPFQTVSWWLVTVSLGLFAIYYWVWRWRQWGWNAALKADGERWLLLPAVHRLSGVHPWPEHLTQPTDALPAAHWALDFVVGSCQTLSFLYLPVGTVSNQPRWADVRHWFKTLVGYCRGVRGFPLWIDRQQTAVDPFIQTVTAPAIAWQTVPLTTHLLPFSPFLTAAAPTRPHLPEGSCGVQVLVRPATPWVQYIGRLRSRITKTPPETWYEVTCRRWVAATTQREASRHLTTWTLNTPQKLPLQRGAAWLVAERRFFTGEGKLLPETAVRQILGWPDNIARQGRDLRQQMVALRADPTAQMFVPSEELPQALLYGTAASEVIPTFVGHPLEAASRICLSGPASLGQHALAADLIRQYVAKGYPVLLLDEGGEMIRELLYRLSDFQLPLVQVLDSQGTRPFLHRFAPTCLSDTAWADWLLTWLNLPEGESQQEKRLADLLYFAARLAWVRRGPAVTLGDVARLLFEESTRQEWLTQTLFAAPHWPVEQFWRNTWAGWPPEAQKWMITTARHLFQPFHGASAATWSLNRQSYAAQTWWQPGGVQVVALRLHQPETFSTRQWVGEVRTQFLATNALTPHLLVCDTADAWVLEQVTAVSPPQTAQLLITQGVPLATPEGDEWVQAIFQTRHRADVSWLGGVPNWVWEEGQLTTQPQRVSCQVQTVETAALPPDITRSQWVASLDSLPTEVCAALAELTTQDLEWLWEMRAEVERVKYTALWDSLDLNHWQKREMILAGWGNGLPLWLTRTLCQRQFGTPSPQQPPVAHLFTCTP